MTWDDLHLPALGFFSGGSSWVGHAPFAMTLVKMLRPEVLVELGAYRGDSYLAFCQAVAEIGLDTRCVAVDTWRGDQHTGEYEEGIYRTLLDEHRRYDRFSILLRTDFDSAAEQFANGSIDLLHIDGLHTYEAVRHDFTTWQPKMSRQGVVLLHDTCARLPGFEVYRFWEEIASQYPSFNFEHSYGLGVLCVGSEPPPLVLHLCQDRGRLAARRNLFARLGELLESEARVRKAAVERGDRPCQMGRKTVWGRGRGELRRVAAKLRRVAGWFLP